MARTLVNTIRTVLNNPVAYLKDVKPSGTNSGTFNSGDWRTRDLNTIEGDSSIITSLSSNQFTLEAGKYLIEAMAAGYSVSTHQLKIRNVSDSIDLIIGQTGRNSTSEDNSGIPSLKGLIELTSQKTFELQHRSSGSRSNNGFGIAGNFGVNEVYAQVKIEKVIE